MLEENKRSEDANRPADKDSLLDDLLKGDEVPRTDKDAQKADPVVKPSSVLKNLQLERRARTEKETQEKDKEVVKDEGA